MSPVSADRGLKRIKSYFIKQMIRIRPAEKKLTNGHYDFHGYISGGWILEAREFSDSMISGLAGETISGIEFYCEHAQTGVQTSEYYDDNGLLVGRKYFDKGDIDKSSMMKHIQGLNTNLKQGRPIKHQEIMLSPEEFIDKIETRGEWYVHSTTSVEYKPTIVDALQQLAYEYGLITEESSDDEVVEVMKNVIREYWRAQKMVRKN